MASFGRRSFDRFSVRTQRFADRAGKSRIGLVSTVPKRTNVAGLKKTGTGKAETKIATAKNKQEGRKLRGTPKG